MIFITDMFIVEPGCAAGPLNPVETARIVNVVVPGKDWSPMGELEIPAGG